MFLKLQCIIVVIYLFFINIMNTKLEVELVNPHTCDRYSLDALYFEKYKLVTEDILTDSTIFIKKLFENIVESFQDLAVKLPDRDSSNKEDMFLYNTLNLMKNSFDKNINKLHHNISAKWDVFIATNHKFLASNENITYKNVIKAIEDVNSAYKYAKIQLDKQMEISISFAKTLIKNSQAGIEEIMNLQDKNHHRDNITEEEKKNITEEKKSIIKEILPYFFLKVTERLTTRKINLSVPISESPEERDSVLDDLCFSITVMMAKVKSLEYTEYSSNDYIDLMRRNLYLLWAETMTSIYKDRIAKPIKRKDPVERFQEFWSNEEELVDTLINLFEVYP